VKRKGEGRKRDRKGGEMNDNKSICHKICHTSFDTMRRISLSEKRKINMLY
jgi:hypothetical protein